MLEPAVKGVSSSAVERDDLSVPKTVELGRCRLGRMLSEGLLFAGEACGLLASSLARSEWLGLEKTVGKGSVLRFRSECAESGEGVEFAG